MKQPPRRRARLFALNVLYSRSVIGVNQTGELLLQEKAKLKEDHLAFAQTIIEKAWENLEQVDQYIKDALYNWKQERISTALNSLFRVAVTEMLFFPDTDAKVVLNEGIEICKDQIDPSSTKLFNGCMHKIFTLARPEEKK